MKYALVKNTPLGDLLDRVSDKVNWKKYGFEPSEVKRSIVQGLDNNKDHCSLIPINNLEAYERCLPILEKKIETNIYDNDSISIIEGSDADALISEIKKNKAVNSG